MMQSLIDLGVQHAVEPEPGPRTCSICLDPLRSADAIAIRLQVCQHLFHAACLEPNIVTARDNLCPLCRRQITHLVEGRAVRQQVLDWDAWNIQVNELESSLGDSLTHLLNGEIAIEEFVAQCRLYTGHLPNSPQRMLIFSMLARYRRHLSQFYPLLYLDVDAQIRLRREAVAIDVAPEPVIRREWLSSRCARFALKLSCSCAMIAGISAAVLSVQSELTATR